jgi:hypothetical protein
MSASKTARPADLSRRTLGLLLVVIALSAAACSGKTGVGEPTPSASSPSPTPTECPNPNNGGACLGPIAAGTYTTTKFQPAITYTVPSGWANFEDLVGNFLLVPPGGNLPGVDADTSDFIGVYATVAAPNGCEQGAAPSVGLKVTDIARWMNQNPGLDTTEPRSITVGGLRGVVLDIRMTAGWKKTCSYAEDGHPLVPILVGSLSTYLDHNVSGRHATRLYLLDNGGTALAIEVVDISGGSHLNGYSRVVETMRFGG